MKDKSATVFNVILSKAHGVGQVAVMGAFVVVAGLVFSTPDYFAKERNAADQDTMKEINQLCRRYFDSFRPRLTCQHSFKANDG